MPLPIKIEHRVGVQAPAEVIWESLYDLATWPSWSVIYPKAAGVVRMEATVDLELALPGHAPREIHPRILDWTPNDLIHWRDRMWRGLITSTRYFEIEVLSETGCIFSNGEIYEGFGIRWFPARLRKTIKAGFAAMGDSLRERSEALWRERGGNAT